MSDANIMSLPSNDSDKPTTANFKEIDICLQLIVGTEIVAMKSRIRHYNIYRRLRQYAKQG